MSLEININHVSGVVIGGTFYKIEKGSFFLDSYEFVDDHGGMVHGGGESGVTPKGYAFKHLGYWFSGPITAIEAVRT